jgi:RNA polymerase sigma-70 factor, ECF subfamily
MSPLDPETLYRDHAADVLRWVIRLGGPDLDVESVAHDVFETALRASGRFRGDSSPRTWLFGLTRRVVANARRRAAFRRFLGLEEVPEPAALADLADEAAIAHQRRRRVQAALDRLSTAQREVVVLADLEGCTAPEVAAMLEIPPGTVYSRLHTARKALRDALRAEGLGEGGLPLGAEVVALPRRRQP